MNPLITWTEVQDAISPFETLFWLIGYIVGGVILHWILSRVIRRSVEEIVSGVKRRRGATDTQAIAVRSPLSAVRTVQRTRTIGSVLQNVVTVVLSIIVIVLCVNRIDPNLLASLSLLSAAIGAGLGFGAQRIVGDVLNGLFMVMEDQLGVGDEVDVEHATGIVEKVGVRITQVRDVHGTLWFVRNGEIARVGSNSQGWNRAIIDLAIPYDVDVEHAKQVMLRGAAALASEPEWMEKFIEEPNVWGMETLSAEAVVVRLVAKTRAGMRWEVERALRQHIQAEFKREGIKLPALNTIVFDGPNGLDVQPCNGTGIDRINQTPPTR